MAETNIPRQPSLATSLRTGFREGLRTSMRLVVWMLPLYVAVDLLDRAGVVERMGHFFAPAMELFGLPGKTAFAFVAAWLLNLYAAIAILVPLDLTPFQVTQCGLMMGIAHNLLLEGGVLRSTGARAGLLTLLRLLLAALAGWLLLGLNALANWLGA